MQRSRATRSPGPILTAIAVAVVGAAEGLQGYGVSLLTPEFAAKLTVSAASLLSARVVGFLLGGLLSLVVPAIPIGRRPQAQAWVARGSGVLCGLVLAWTGTVTSTAGLIVVLCLGAAVGAPAGARHRALAIDVMPADRLVGTLSLVYGVALLAQAGLAATVAAGGLHATAHSFKVLGLVVVMAVALASFAVRAVPAATSDTEALTWKQIARAWRTTPTIVGIGAAWFAIGVLQLPFLAVLAIYLRGHRHLSSHGVGIVFLVVALAAAAALLLNHRRGERQLADAPQRLAAESWVLLSVGSLLLGVGGYAPGRVLLGVGVALGASCVAAAVPMLSAIAFTVVPAGQRAALSAALAGVWSIGAAVGAVYATSFMNRHGPRSALVAMAVLGVAASVIWRGRAKSLPTDRRRVLDDDLDLEQRQATVASGGHLPLLACHGIDFAYSGLQVLFDVDFTIDEGEVVALLGTNGAGKSTLLKVISGIELPQRGSVRLSGRDITYLDAEDRVRLGVTQVPGGRAVFGSMTVVENLQTFGYTLGRDRRAVAAAIERCLDTFPRLADRRTSLAATLSGGEQQMVGLCKALILKPRLLLIDELSLGLAPIVIGPLLDTVSEINATGTAVVIVEQSVNIALSLAEHAYFMEKGSIRFDGRAKDLLDRQDLLRAVFLEGAAKTALS